MKKNHFVIYGILFFVICSLFISCGSKEKADRISLNSGWEYTLEDPQLYNSTYYPLSDADLSHLENLVPGKNGFIWVRNYFDVPLSLQNQDLSCYLGRVSIADKTYLNQLQIGNGGRFPPNEFSAWNTSRFYEIPDAIIKAKHNELIVQIFVDGEGSIVSGPFIGLHDDTKLAYDHERFYNSSINLLFAFMMIIIGIYHSVIFAKNKNEKEALYFAFLNIITAFYLVVFYYPDIPGFPFVWVNFLAFQKIFSSSLPFVLVYLVGSFVNAYLNRKDSIPFVIGRLVFMLFPIFIILISPDYVHLRELRNWINYLLVIPLVYVAYISVKAVFKKKKDAVPLLLGFSPFVITALLDVVLHDIAKLYNIPYFSPYGWQLVIIALLFVLANRFSNARRQAEYLNIHLADEVEARTKELSESNELLTTANSQLEDAKIKAERDMKMAVYVQQSFFPRKAPLVDGWDIAYVFKPMAGVSGDLYDFFTHKNQLNGVALFDVSGHGIASGLVTMLAKSVIDREFNSKMDLHLGRVMKDINDSIVAEKGNVENYLTGMIVRIKDDKVEYINAGHPATFVRNGKTGKCTPIELKQITDSSSNAIVGVSGLDVDFKVIGFTMQPGDALIMYTDCLSESRNKNGEEFSQQGVCNAFAESGNGSAQAKLDKVLEIFNKFTEGVPLNDDLSAIVLQKK